MEKISEGIYRKDGKIYTINNTDKYKYYDENVLIHLNNRYRQWNPYKSKVGASIKKKLKEIPISRESVILYLGSSSGTTVSHISDILTNGKIFAVDSSKEMMKKFMKLVHNRKNIFPILESARNYKKYNIPSDTCIDLIVQDVACVDQVNILINNSDYYLKSNGKVLIAIKTQSIDSIKKPGIVVEEQKEILKGKFKILQTLNLEPFEKNHWLLFMEKKE
ncbi:MAG: fibrillarin-like rRNA/tRNA 2'-O-methyltransferase [Candidatus Woesearchaeota archaeon]